METTVSRKAYEQNAAVSANPGFASHSSCPKKKIGTVLYFLLLVI